MHWRKIVPASAFFVNLIVKVLVEYHLLAKRLDLLGFQHYADHQLIFLHCLFELGHHLLNYQ